jgi:hypothetical protein
MDCIQEVVANYSKILNKTFLSISHISCNLANGYKMPNTQPLHGTLHLYFLVFFYLLKGNHPNSLVFDKSAWDMDIMTLWKNEQFYSKFVFFDCYSEVHQKILNFIHAILQNCKHLPKSKIL